MSIASFAVETVSTHRLVPETLIGRVRRSYGDTAAAEIGQFLGAQRIAAIPKEYA
jgi:hypothetical protein